MASAAPWDPPRAEESSQLDPKKKTLLTTLIAVFLVGRVCVYVYVCWGHVFFGNFQSMNVNKFPPSFHLHCAACLTGNLSWTKTV